MTIALEGSVGPWRLRMRSVPRGTSGTLQVEHPEMKGQWIDVRWRRDEHGIELMLPDGVRSFDLRGEMGDDGGVSYQALERLGHRSWNDLRFMRAGMEAVAASVGTRKVGARVRAQMPGKVVRVCVKEGDTVVKEQPLVVLEAMKMENEIRAPLGGKVSALRVAQGQTVESGADLLRIEPV